MIVFTRSYLVRTDSRLHRYMAVLNDAGVAWHAVAWDRTGHEPADPHCTFHRQPSPVGGGWRNLGRILAWNVALFRALWRRRREIRVVHAVDLDTALGATAFCVLTGTRLLYDAFDQYSDTRNLTGLAKRACDALERLCMRRAAVVLVPDACRIAQHGIQGWPNVVVLENVPTDTAAAQAARRQAVVPSRPPWRLVYVGTLEPVHRGLEDLMAVVARAPQQASLLVAGTGPLASHAAAMAAAHDNIQFVGQVSPDQALQLMGEGDVIVGLYYLSSHNHRYAAPNKYYEHLMLGKPLLTTAGTPPGQRVVAHQTGWAIAAGQPALQSWLENLEAAALPEHGRRAAALWEQAYGHYASQVLAPLYLASLGPAYAARGPASTPSDAP